MRSQLRDIFFSTMEALDVNEALARVQPRVERFVDGRSVRLIAFGKAAVSMTGWFRDAVGGVATGVVSAPDCGRSDWMEIRCFNGGHPVPNEDSVRAAHEALDLASGAGVDDAVVFLVSGGGSALLEAPLSATIGLEEVRRLHAALVSCGAGIVEMNAVRKHVSAVKGGRLALAAFPARQLTLYISDVPDGCDASVASGPTMPDDTSTRDARRVVSAYGLKRSLPGAVLALLSDPGLPETPKSGDACFRRSEWVRILSNQDAIDAALRFVGARGWLAEVDTSVDEMPVADAARHLLARLRAAATRAGHRPVCVVSGGELSSPVTGDGVGGRNQAFVLECASRIAGERVAVMSAGTDGVDGNSPAAGATADGSTLERARALGVDPGDYARRSDAHTFFKRLGDDITCGPTGNNVRDLRVLVSWPA